jgi:hypothetical protein
MADFRKLLMALALVVLFVATSVPASAQLTQALQCVANAGVPPIVRAEGLAELVGDLVLNCTGGQPTQNGAVVPGSNVQIFLNTNITSRLLANASGGLGWSEALLMLDEPHSTSNPTRPIRVCGDANTNENPANPGVCTVFGLPIGQQGNVYSGANPGPDNTSVNRPNTFQGRQVGVNSILWAGVPIDPPGTSTTRVIRITNVRANANQLGVSSTLVPTSITMYVSITGSTALPINNPTQTVAFIQPGLTSAVRFATTFLQCISQNRALAVGDSSRPSPNEITYATTANQGYQFVVRSTEGFPTAFKYKNIAQALVANPLDQVVYPNTFANQNVPGAIYNTEDGFVNSNTGSYVEPNPNPPLQLVTGAGTVSPTPANPNVRGLPEAGKASQGTRLYYNFTSVPNGSQLWVPAVMGIYNVLTGTRTGIAVLTSTDGNGAGGFSRIAGSGTASVPFAGPNNSTGVATTLGGLSQVSIFNGAGIAVYEVLFADPFSQERADLPVAVAYAANPGNNLPTPGVQSQVTVSFAPLSNVGTAADLNTPAPRFAPGQTPRNLFLLQKCNCNLLFPFVTNQLGYDTGVAISNTSLDTGTGFGTTPQQGVVRLFYYCGQTGCTSPPSQTTNAPVPAGQQLTFTLSGGGNYGIAGTPGFQGYIIAQADFQFCHAFAYISAQGATPTSNGASMGYLALVMDAPGIYRPLVTGESLGH